MIGMAPNAQRRANRNALETVRGALPAAALPSTQDMTVYILMTNGISITAVAGYGRGETAHGEPGVFVTMPTQLPMPAISLIHQ
jgi:hypothetical protein